MHNNDSEHEILLSICIPTYNRCEHIEETLKSITTDTYFLENDSIEVIISDNCSTDNTEKICKEYSQKYPEKILYFKTDNNIGGDKNFVRALSLARGKLLKLNNDKCSFLPNALETIVNCIKSDEKQEFIWHFPNKLNGIKETEITCLNLDEFINKLGYKCTWIGAFAIWKKDFEEFTDFDRYVHLQLMQDDVIFRQLANGKTAKICNKELFKVLVTNDIGGYNPALVFGQNYLTMLKEYVDKNELSKKTFEKEKYNVLTNQIGWAFFDLKRKYRFKNDGLFKYLIPYYKNDLYFYIWYTNWMVKKLFYTILINPLRKIFTQSWYNINIFIYKFIIRSESKVKKFTEKKNYYKKK